MDDEIKKILEDLKMEDLLKQTNIASEQKNPDPVEPKESQEFPLPEEIEPEPIVSNDSIQKSRSFFSKTLLICLFLGSFFAIGGAAIWYRSEQEPSQEVVQNNLIAAEDEDDYDDGPYGERTLSTTAWAEKIDEKDLKIGDGIRSLWTLLANRQNDLEDVTDEIVELLDDNAFIHRNFFIDQANTLFARYTSMDSRYTLEISQQIALLKDMVDQKQDSELTLAFAEMLNDLGCDEYSRYRHEIVDALVDEGIAWRRALDLVKKADSLSQLDVALDQGLKDLEQMRKTSVTELFIDIAPLRKQLTGAVQQSIEHLLVQSNVSTFTKPKNRAILQSILIKGGVGESTVATFMRKFDSMASSATASKGVVNKKSV